MVNIYELVVAIKKNWRRVFIDERTIRLIDARSANGDNPLICHIRIRYKKENLFAPSTVSRRQAETRHVIQTQYTFKKHQKPGDMANPNPTIKYTQVKFVLSFGWL